MFAKPCLNKSIFNAYRTGALNPTSKLHVSSTLSSHEKAKKTILYDFHERNGGKIVDFAGWLMPVQYNELGIKESHIHTRTNCSLFDVSHMMQTKVYGKDRFKYIESMIVSDIEGLKPNTGCLSVFTNEQGGIEDDLIVNNTDKDYLYVVSNAGCSEKDFANMKRVEEEMRGKDMDVKLERLEEHGLIAVQGPKMKEVLQNGVKFDMSKLMFMNTVEAEVYGIKNCRVTRCGYTGEDGVEISVPAKDAVALADELLQYESGKVCKLAGLGARDTLRLEAGLCLYGNDIDEKTTPVEAGLAWTISKRRRQEKSFPGAEIIMNQLKEKPLIRRVGLKLLKSSGPSARQHMKILNTENVEIGEVTSGCLSPTLNEQIAMAYVKTPFAKAGTKVQVKIRNRIFEAEVVKMPFVPSQYYTSLA